MAKRREENVSGSSSTKDARPRGFQSQVARNGKLECLTKGCVEDKKQRITSERPSKLSDANAQCVAYI